jgi:hypothetical protein
MLTHCKSTVLGAVFLAGVAIAANADPLCYAPTGLCQPPGPQIAALPSANSASASDRITLPQVNVFGPTGQICESALRKRVSIQNHGRAL